MKDDKYFFDFDKEPGKELNNYIKHTGEKPLVSIITSYYNGHQYMDQTVNCVLNQTFPYWEWIIVDDGSTDKDSLKYLENLEKIDSRIHVYHKENGGLATGRDYGIKFSTTEYILPLDSDDLIDKTFIETTWWTLETNKDATWAFTNSVGFGKWKYLSDCIFDSNTMKTDNQITATALIRKDKILELNGYSVAKRYVNEDWHLWLRMLQKGYFPVQVNFYGFWYRRRHESLLTEINNENNKENELRLHDIKEEADKIKDNVLAKTYTKKSDDYNAECDYTFTYERNCINKKHAICYLMPYLPVNINFLNLIKEKSSDNEIYIITTKANEYSQYVYRQELEEHCTIFDLTSFLDKNYYISFIKYLTKTRNIDRIKEVEIGDEKCEYNKMIFNYKIQHTLLARAVKKLIPERKANG